MSLIDSIIAAESGGDPYAKNPNSSASGPGQFIDSTWLSTIKAARPDLANGKSDSELLALKTDPDLSRQMTEAYAAQNGDRLTKAGFDANPGNIYLAHFAGPNGAINVLSANPNTPVVEILGAKVAAANPFLRNMTAGQLAGWAANKVGGSAAPVQTAQAATGSLQPPAQAPAQQPGAPLPAVQPASGGGFYSQVPAETPLQPLPLLTPQRRPVSLAALQQALQASQSRGAIFGKA